GMHLCLRDANNTVYNDVCVAQYYTDSPVLPVEFFDPTSWIKQQVTLPENDFYVSQLQRPSAARLRGRGHLPQCDNSTSPTGPVIHEIDTAEFFDECEPTTVEPVEEGQFINTDLCDAVINAENEGQSPTSSTNQVSSSIPDPTASNPESEVLPELAEDCPLSPSILLTASPLEVNPAIVTPRLSKGKVRARVGSNESKKRKSKNVNINNKAENPSNVSITAVPVYSKVVDPLSLDPLDIDSGETVNSVDLLDVVFPALVAETEAAPVEKKISNKSIKTQSKEIEMASDSIADATNEAISAINDVAAAHRNTNKSSRFVSLLNGKSVSKPIVNGTLPVTNDFRETSVIGSKTDKKNKKVDPSDVMVFKQEPSTSSNNDTHSSNMVLACTGNSSGENFNRCGIKDDIDSHFGSLQSELDSLREILKGENYSLDANTLLGLFDDPLSDLPLTGFENLTDEQEKEGITGNELTTYSSNLFDMADMADAPETGVWNGLETPDASSIMDVSLSELNSPQMTKTKSDILKKMK
ncbi:hypothetical protein L9F63_021559, partial [Diploptera punctata]